MTAFALSEIEEEFGGKEGMRDMILRQSRGKRGSGAKLQLFLGGAILQSVCHHAFCHIFDAPHAAKSASATELCCLIELQRWAWCVCA
jgi:hypothetical protein